MKKFVFTVICTMVFGVSVASAQKAMNLEERVAELEANQSLNIFKLSGTFWTRYDSVNHKQDTPTEAEEKSLDYLRLRFSLNVDADVSKYIKFYSRYTTTKHFNTWREAGSVTPIAQDLGASDNYRSSAVVLEKAYVDLLIPDTNLALSIGRLPTVDGQPTNYWDGRARMGTYPMLSYNSVFDGFAVSYNAGFVPQDHKLALRAVYTPWSQYYVGTGGHLVEPTVDGGGKAQTNIDMYAGQIDYSIKDIGFAENFGIIVQYYKGGKLPYVVGTGNSSLSIRPAGTTVATELNRIAGTGVDVSLSYFASELKSEGSLSGVGFGTLKASENVTGNIVLLSTKYNMSSWIIGAEYLNGSKQASYFYNSEDITNFYSTNGQAYHLYATKKFTDTLSLRGGYTQQDLDYQPISVGPAVKTDRVINSAYLNLRLDF